MSLKCTFTRSVLLCSASVAAFLLMSSTLLVAQTIEVRWQPDRLDFGTVMTGATVEGSVRVFKDGHDTDGVSFKVDPPAFANIKSIELGTQAYGTKGTKIVCDIFLSVNTHTVGEHSGVLSVKVGSEKSRIPVSVNISPRDSSATSALVVETPFDRFSAKDASTFDAWIQLVDSVTLDVNYMHVFRNQSVLRDLDLSTFDVILLGENGLISLLESDVAKLKQYASDGGRLIVCADAFFQGTVGKANEVLHPAGLHMTDIETVGEGAFDQAVENLDGNSFLDAVQSVRFYRPSPVAVTDKSKGKILIEATHFPGEGFLAAGQLGKGQVIALGQSLWWNWIGDARYKGSDNQRLLLNLFTTREKVN